MTSLTRIFMQLTGLKYPRNGNRKLENIETIEKKSSIYRKKLI